MDERDQFPDILLTFSCHGGEDSSIEGVSFTIPYGEDIEHEGVHLEVHPKQGSGLTAIGSVLSIRDVVALRDALSQYIRWQITNPVVGPALALSIWAEIAERSAMVRLANAARHLPSGG